MPRSLFRTALCFSILLAIPLLPSNVCFAQSPAPANAVEASSTFSIMDLISYNPQVSGPLVWVTLAPAQVKINAGNSKDLEKLRKETPRQFAEHYNSRVFNQSTLTLIAPREQRVIADVPGKPADRFAKMNSRERFSVLLSLFSRGQWNLATSRQGIGPADMNEEQRNLWLSLLPGDKISLRKNRRVPVDDSSYRYEQEGSPQEFAPDAARLRLVRRIEFQFQQVGADDRRFSSSTDGPVGANNDVEYMGELDTSRDDYPDESKPFQVFGATIFQTVPNRLKPGGLDFNSPVLAAAIPLNTESETVGQVLARIGKIVRLDLRCDKRVRDIHVHRLVAPGATVSASDLLQAVCLGVCGTFRKITPSSGDPVYLLTYDTEGIGTRILRWASWAEDADQKRYDMVAKATDQVAALDPLDMIGFAPNDPNALPPALLSRVDAAYRKERFAPAPVFQMSELPPALQKQARDRIDWWQKQGSALRSDSLRIGTELTCQILFPGNIAVEPGPYGRDFQGQYLQKIAAVEKPRPSAPVPPETVTKPVSLPASTGRRVLLLAFPTTSEETQKMLRVAQRKAFTDVWLRFPLESDAKRRGELAAAIKYGMTLGLRIGAVVDVLRGYHGTPDVNALGETGEEFVKRVVAKNPDRDYYKYNYPGWNVWDARIIRSGLLPLASVPGLSALALQATAAPGNAGVVHGGDSIVPGGHLGYTIPMRLACLEASGVDPIDAGNYSYTLGVNPEVGLFRAGESWDEQTTFRWEQNKHEMAGLYQTLRTAAPKLPLYLNDRASSYGHPNSSWYVRWVAADRIPVCPCYAVESEHREAAAAVSPEILLNEWSRKGRPMTFANAVAKTITNSAKWNGATVDCSSLSPADALLILNGIADTKKP